MNLDSYLIDELITFLLLVTMEYNLDLLAVILPSLY